MIDLLLATCACAEGHSVQTRQLEAQAKRYEEWPSLPQRAEEQGMAPLLYRHLKPLATPVPEDCLKVLAGLTLRHRQANTIRNGVLVDYLQALGQQNVEALVLKGAALANSAYPQPGLRPMRDMDLLVRHTDAIRAQQILCELGFSAEIPEPEALSSSHQLPVAQRVVEGLTVSIEVHHWLLPTNQQPASQAVTFEMLRHRARTLQVVDEPALTLGHEDMLWHIYRHAMAKPLIAQPVRMIWVADLTSYVEKYLDEIDWPRLRSTHPEIWNILPLFHWLTPWSKKVLDKLQLAVDQPPKGAGVMFQGWPQSSLAQQREKGLGAFLKDTFWPPEWWLRLYYGAAGRGPGWWWTRLIRHPLHIGGWVLHYLRE